LAPILIWLMTLYVLPHTTYKIGFELIVYNGLITFILLWFTSPGRASDKQLSAK
jgi:hypothetical protein